MGKTYKKDNNFKGFKPKKDMNNAPKTSLRFTAMRDGTGNITAQEESYRDYDEEDNVNFEKFTKKR